MTRPRLMPLVLAAIMLFALALPGIASACPQCAGNDKGGIAVGVVIGSMILLPYPVVWFVVRLIRKHADS